MRPRLYLVTPPALIAGDLAVAGFAKTLEKALAAGDVAAVLLRSDGAEDSRLRGVIAALRPVSHARDVALVVEGRADLAAELGCDGVQVPASPGTLRAVRRALGADMIVGAACGDSRHDAMVAGELEVDYVAFDADALETIAWWAEMMEVPCVAAGGITLAGAPALIEAGADFLAVGRAVWEHPKGPAAAVKALNKLLAEA